MTTKDNKKSAARKFMEEITGGPLTLSSLLYSIRLGEEMTQEEFAQMLGISKSHVCDIEKGRKHVSPLRAKEFARILKHSEQQFIRLALQDIVDQLSQKHIWQVELKKAA
ncbi:MAG: helix-turn-helix transcriptional regulator [Myxococcales bacterium]|nr:helix-turn-helix transcriptional regulator [Myxococcales bacterium]USN51660.1 MAG: helix-turn-helix transcriptional regulator [Myxococcales bacterium]